MGASGLGRQEVGATQFCNVLVGREADFATERLVEAGVVRKAAAGIDVCGLKAVMHELFGEGDALGKDVLVDCAVGIFLEFTAQVVFIDEEFVGDGV